MRNVAQTPLLQQERIKGIKSLMRRTAVRYASAAKGVLSEWTRELQNRGFSAGIAPQWVFLGPPGVGKGTYSKRIAKHINVPHISTGDLVRAEVAKKTPIGMKMHEINLTGHLLPDEMVLKLLYTRLENERRGFVLDGFPRTLSQAQSLSQHTDIHLVVNLDLREEVLVEKCLGRRTCGKCGKDFNLADIHLKAEHGKKEIVMPPLPPPPECLKHMKMRDDDREDIIKKRLQVYRAEAEPIEDFYRDMGVLLDFEITGGIPETLPVLLQVLQKYFPPDFSEESRKMVA